MAEQLGTLLWQWRGARGWSLGQLAQQAGVSKSAVARWEAGKRQPRLPELEATLTALGCTQAQRVRALACIEAPRAIRRLNASSASTSPGPLPAVNDLLRALRFRGGWTQAQIAERLGVGQNTIARWERGERRPSSEQMQALCFALAAREEEIVALTTGRFAEMPEACSLDPEAVHDCLLELLYNPRSELVDLRFLALERELWQQAAREEATRGLLAKAYATHAHYLSNYHRWGEVGTLAQRALALSPREETISDYRLRAVLKLAAAEVYGGNRLTPERGIQRLKPWLSGSQWPELMAWMFSDMGQYLTLAGEGASGIALSAQAVAISQLEREMRQIDHGRLLLVGGQPQTALDQLPGLSELARDRFVLETLIRVEAHQQLNQSGVAHDYLQRVYRVIETERLGYLRPRADTLAQKF